MKFIKNFLFLLCPLFLLACVTIGQAQQNQVKATDIEEWAKNTAQDIMTYNYLNQDQHFEDIKPYFTKAGHQSFLKAMERSRISEMVVKHKQKVTMKMMNTQLCRIYEHDGTTHYAVFSPVKIYYRDEGKKDDLKSKFGLTLIITESAEPHLKDNLEINQWLGAINDSCDIAYDAADISTFYNKIPDDLEEEIKIEAKQTSDFFGKPVERYFYSCSITNFLSDGLNEKIKQYSRLDFCETHRRKESSEEN